MSLVPLSALLPSGRAADHVIAERNGVPLTFAGFAADVASNAHRMAAHRCRAGILVAEDSYWYLVGLMALFQIGATVVLPPNAQPATLREMAPLADLTISDRPLGTALVLAPAAGEMAALHHLDAGACRLDIFTSGSTGERKRIAKTLAQLETEIGVIETLWGERVGRSTFHGLIGHQHIFGLTFRVLWPAMAGRRFAAASHLAWETLLTAQSAPATLVVSPAHLQRLGGLPPLAEAAQPRAVFTAGAPLPRAAALEARDLLGSLPIEIFGSTETGAIAWRQQAVEDAVWQALPGTRLTQADDGTLEIRSPFLLADAVHASADLVAFVPGGFRFDGRADRIGKFAGKRVSLSEIERDLAAHPWLRDAVALALGADRDILAVVAVPSRIGAGILAERGKFRFERALRQALAERHDPGALPRRWRFVEAIPVDVMGKRPLAELQSLFESRLRTT